MIQPETVIWDFNGTILNDTDLSTSAINELLKRRGLPGITRESHRNGFRFPIVDYYRGLGFDLEKEAFSDISDEFHDIYFEGVGKCELNAGVAEALALMKGLRIRQFVLSAAEQQMLDSWVKTVGVHEFFEGIYGLQDHLAVSKVDRARELMDVFGLTGESTLLIGDTDHDAEVAKAIGCAVILVPIGHQSRERIKLSKALFVDSVEDVIGLVREWESGIAEG